MTAPAAAESYEMQLYRRLTLAGAFVALGLVIPVNLAQSHLSRGIDLAMAIFGAASLVLFALARRGRALPIVFCFANVAALDAVFFFDGGSDGAVPMFLYDGVLLFTVFARGRPRAVAVALYIVNNIGLFVLERSYPSWVSRVPPGDARFWDLVTGVGVSAIGCALIAGSLIDAYRREHAQLAQRNVELAQSLAEVRTLRGLLSICAWCRNMRADDGTWVPLETYIPMKTGAALTHGICPSCRHGLEGDDHDSVDLAKDR